MATKTEIVCKQIVFEGFIQTRGWKGAATKKATRDSVTDQDAKIVVDLASQTFTLTPNGGGDEFSGPLAKVKQWFPKPAAAK